MKKLPYFLIAPFILLVSCNKTLIETGTVRGVVKDATTDQPVPFADVFLLRNEIGDGDIIGGGGPSEEIDYVAADENGNFSFNFDYDKNYYYLCGAESELYFDLNQEFAIDEDIKEGFNVEVLLNPVAWLEIHCENVSPIDGNDDLTISLLLNGENPELLGENVDTTLCCFSISGNFENRIVWYVTKGGDDASFFEYIYCPAFDTTFFEILY